MGFLDRTGLTRKITRARLERFLRRYQTDRSTLDVGCGSAQYRSLFPRCVTLDIAARPGVSVDIVGDAHHMPQVMDASFDVVLCTEVLSYLHTPSQAVSEFRRVLRPGGLLLLSTRFVFPINDAPGDLYRFTKYGLRHLLRDFEILELKEEADTIETLAVLLQRIGFQCDTLGWRPLKLFWFLLARFTQLFSFVITREYGDIGHGRPEKNILASGYYVAARKK